MNLRLYFNYLTKLNKREISILIFAVLFNFVVYYGGRMIGQSQAHFDFSSSIDQSIPLIPQMVYVYWGCYIFWAINYIICAKDKTKNADNFFLAHCIGELVCVVAFVFLPTTMVRPEVTGNLLCEEILRRTYLYDSADNLLPSIHCFVSWLCWIGVRKNELIPKWYRYASLLMAIAVCISTVTVKQHILLDVFVGILLAEGSYCLAKIIINMKK